MAGDTLTSDKDTSNFNGIGFQAATVTPASSFVEAELSRPGQLEAECRKEQTVVESANSRQGTGSVARLPISDMESRLRQETDKFRFDLLLQGVSSRDRQSVLSLPRTPVQDKNVSAIRIQGDSSALIPVRLGSIVSRIVTFTVMAVLACYVANYWMMALHVELPSFAVGKSSIVHQVTVPVDAGPGKPGAARKANNQFRRK